MACSFSMIRQSQSGTSGMISRIGRGCSSADALEHRQRAAGAERRAAGAHHVEHAAEAEEIGAVVERFALRLLGGHVHRRAGDDAGLRDAGVVGGAGQAEIGDLDALFRPGVEQDVRRLDVAVDEVHLVRGGESRGDLLADPQYLGNVERAGAVEALLQRLAGDELHDEVGQSFLVAADVVDLDDVLVPDVAPRDRASRRNRLRAGEVAAIDGARTLTATTR